MSCLDYKLTRRSMVGATAATIMGLRVKDLLAFSGTSHKPTAEHVIFFWCGGGMTHLSWFGGEVIHRREGCSDECEKCEDERRCGFHGGDRFKVCWRCISNHRELHLPAAGEHVCVFHG